MFCLAGDEEGISDIIPGKIERSCYEPMESPQLSGGGGRGIQTGANEHSL